MELYSGHYISSPNNHGNPRFLHFQGLFHPYLGGPKPSCFMVLGSKGMHYYKADRSELQYNNALFDSPKNGQFFHDPCQKTLPITLVGAHLIWYIQAGDQKLNQPVTTRMIDTHHAVWPLNQCHTGNVDDNYNHWVPYKNALSKKTWIKLGNTPLFMKLVGEMFEILNP